MLEKNVKGNARGAGGEGGGGGGGVGGTEKKHHTAEKNQQ